MTGAVLRTTSADGEQEEPIREHNHGQDDSQARLAKGALPDHSNTVESTAEQSLLDATYLAAEIQRQEDELQRLERYITVKSEWASSGFNDYESDDQHQETKEDTCVATCHTEEAETPSIDPPAYSELAIRSREEETRAAPQDSQATSFPIMLSVPVNDDEVALKSIDELPPDVRTTLQDSFQRMRSFPEHRAARYRGVKKDPRTYAKKPMCIRDCLVRTRGEIGTRASFRETGKASADVRCTKAREPCTFLIMHDKVPTLCMVPLPEEKRIGKAWTELEYWIRD